MNTFLSHFRQPYPFSGEWAEMFKGALFGGIIVTMFLFLFRPFGTDLGNMSLWRGFLMCSEFGAVTFVCGVIWGGALRALPHISDEKNWTVGREIISNLLLISFIALSNLFFTVIKYGQPITFSSFIDWQIITFLVGIVPVTGGVLLKEMRLNRAYKAAASQLSMQMHEHTDNTKTPPSAIQSIQLQGENQQETLTLLASQICYLTAADNYVQVYYLDSNHQLRQKMMRSTLKKMEESLANYPNLCRCHRAYIVNLSKVIDVSGNAQGYRLTLQHTDETIPVSRSLNDSIKEKISAFSV